MRFTFFLLLLAGPAAADPPSWRFKTGDKLIYECRSAYDFTQTRVKDGKEIFCSAPQVEETTLQATVLATGDDGAARIEFEVLAERIESTWADTGASCSWDSAKDKAEVCPGLERYAAIFGHKFTAVIGPDGKIRETSGAKWPKACRLAQKERASKGERSAADTTRDPTSAEAWLQLIFGTTPTGEEAWKRTFDLPDAEAFALKPDGQDKVGSATCMRVAFETEEKQPEGVVVPAERRRKGHASFSPASGRMLRVELEGAEESKRYKPGKFGRIEWKVELKKVTEAGAGK